MDSPDPFKLNDPFQPFPGNDSPKEKDPEMFCDPFTSATTTTNKEADPSNFANFSAVSTVNELFGGKIFKDFSEIILESAKFASF